jgi:hypothetical protein
MKKTAISLLLLACLTAIAQDKDTNTGYVFIKSIPSGASIFMPGRDPDDISHYGLMDTGKKTPCLVEIEKTDSPGGHEIVLKLDGFEDTTFAIKVNQAEVAKPETFVMKKRTWPVIILFSDVGWVAFVDGKPVLEVSSSYNVYEGNYVTPVTAPVGPSRNRAFPPCAVKMTSGKHEVALAKEGFADLTTQVVVGGEKMITVDFDKIGLKTTKGESSLLKSNPQETVSNEENVWCKVAWTEGNNSSNCCGCISKNDYESVIAGKNNEFIKLKHCFSYIDGKVVKTKDIFSGIIFIKGASIMSLEPFSPSFVESQTKTIIEAEK